MTIVLTRKTKVRQGASNVLFTRQRLVYIVGSFTLFTRPFQRKMLVTYTTQPERPWVGTDPEVVVVDVDAVVAGVDGRHRVREAVDETRVVVGVRRCDANHRRADLRV